MSSVGVLLGRGLRGIVILRYVSALIHGRRSRGGGNANDVIQNAVPGKGAANCGAYTNVNTLSGIRGLVGTS